MQTKSVTKYRNSRAIAKQRSYIIKISLPNGTDFELDVVKMRNKVPFIFRGEIDSFMSDPKSYLQSGGMFKKLFKMFMGR